MFATEIMRRSYAMQSTDCIRLDSETPRSYGGMRAGAFRCRTLAGGVDHPVYPRQRVVMGGDVVAAGEQQAHRRHPVSG